jgi:thiamine biosynthesis lipoprotein
MLVASNEGSDFDLDNDAYRDQLIKLFSYTAYRQVDDTVAPLVKLWGFFDQKYRVPNSEEIETALKKVGRERIVVEDGIVRLVEGTEIDPGAVGKGFGVDRAVAVLKQAGVASAFVDFGSTVYALGAPPGKEGWTLAIRDPFQTGRTLGTLTIRDASVSTSGDYEKRFEADGKKYGHILDPRTGRPVEGVASVSVLASSGTESDALSTAIFVSGFDLAAKAKVEAFVVPADPKSEPRATDGWAKRFRRN